MAAHVARHLASDGFTVTVFTKAPFDENGKPILLGRTREDGTTVIRIRTTHPKSPARQLLGGLILAVRLVLHCARPKKRYDFVTVQTIPPILMGLSGRIAARLAGARLVYHAMDLHPEAALSVDDLHEGNFARVLRWLDRSTVDAAAAVVVLSEDMAVALDARGSRLDHVYRINNFNPIGADERAEIDSSYKKRPGTTRFLFAGNMGRFQGLEDLVDAFKSARDESPELELCFLGDGARKEALIERAGTELGRSIKFWDRVPPDVAAALLASSDAAIVSLAPGVIRVAYPSKTMACLEAGAPLLAVVEPASELARMIEEYGVGAVAAPGDIEAIRRAFLAVARLSGSPDIKARVTSVGREWFGREPTLAKWTALFDALAQSGRA